MSKCCVTCVYAVKKDGEWICTNEESEGYGLETMFNDYCGEWEERE